MLIHPWLFRRNRVLSAWGKRMTAKPCADTLRTLSAVDVTLYTRVRPDRAGRIFAASTVIWRGWLCRIARRR